jgi:mevalonate kinase
LIPAKTFLVGEYVALQGGPALVLTTAPCFEVRLTTQLGFEGIHQDAPAARWWIQQGTHTHGLVWFDPYQGLGGLGASSAQFLGAYAGAQYLITSSPAPLSIPKLLDAYLQSASQDSAIQPSGYDVLGQYLQGCAYIHHQAMQYKTFVWPFEDLGFILLRTGLKIPTHEHLKHLHVHDNLNELTQTAALACDAFQCGDRHQLIDAVSLYHRQLKQRGWVSPHSLQCIEHLDTWLKPLAIKGCGAMGADVVLILVAAEQEERYKQQLTFSGWNVLATSQDLWNPTPTS